MAVTFWSAYLFQRKPDAYSALSLAALIILIFDPTQLVQPSFIFSFVIVLGLIALCSPFSDLFYGLNQPDPWKIDEESK